MNVTWDLLTIYNCIAWRITCSSIIIHNTGKLHLGADVLLQYPIRMKNNNCEDDISEYCENQTDSIVEYAISSICEMLDQSDKSKSLELENTSQKYKWILKVRILYISRPVSTPLLKWKTAYEKKEKISDTSWKVKIKKVKTKNWRLKIP